MANALIAVEKRLYEESGTTARRPWEVVERLEETADVVTFRLRPADGGPVRGFRAGQYVSVQAELPDGARQIRQYSLSGATGENVRQFSVKRAHGGDAPEGEVSNHLHTRVHEGDVLDLSEPYGDLVLGDITGRPLLPASAGIGVTPMVAMLAALAADNHDAPVTVVHGDRSPADHALRNDHESYAAKLADASVHFFYERDAEPGTRTGLVDLGDVEVAAGARVPVRPAALHADGARPPVLLECPAYGSGGLSHYDRRAPPSRFRPFPPEGLTSWAPPTRAATRHARRA